VRWDSRASAEDIIAGYQQIASQLQVNGVKVIGGTLTPAKRSAPGYCEEAEATRRRLNIWIRTSGALHGVIDFDAATRDPADPLKFLPAYDSGDGLHPNDAGYEAMANAIDLELFNR
jgi:lysophospholipase L1-like esterase